MRRNVGATRRKSRKHHTRRTGTRRRRRIGAAGNMGSLVNVIGGLTLGAGGARFLMTQLGNIFPFLKSNQIVDGAAQMALGYFLPKFVKGQFFQFVGYGMIASGGQTVMVGTGIISGAGNVMTYKIGAPLSNLRVINGTGNLKVVGAIGDNRVQNPQPMTQAAIRAKGFSHTG